MIKTVKQACVFNPIIRDYRMSQAIENLADLITDAGDGQEFFARNYITQGILNCANRYCRLTYQSASPLVKPKLPRLTGATTPTMACIA